MSRWATPGPTFLQTCNVLQSQQGSGPAGFSIHTLIATSSAVSTCCPYLTFAKAPCQQVTADHDWRLALLLVCELIGAVDLPRLESAPSSTYPLACETAQEQGPFPGVSSFKLITDIRTAEGLQQADPLQILELTCLSTKLQQILQTGSFSESWSSKVV